MYEQKETASGYLLYVNRQTGEQQNDNPQLIELMRAIREKHKSIKYVTYRCATKIWFLKQSMYTVNIPYNLVISVLNHHGFTQSDNVPILKPSHLTAIIHDIYFAAAKCDLFKQSVDFNLDRCTAMLANFCWNIYDPNRTTSLSLLEFKQLMLILCNTPNFGQLTTEAFHLVADHNRCVNRFRFESIIKVIAKFFFYMEESSLFRFQSIGGMIKECFEQCPGIIGLTERQFIELWLKQNIGFSHYSNIFALLYRIKESQNIVHEVDCVGCKQSPIAGIRFKCQQCRNLSLCYECFCTGYKTSKHEYTHRMYEISTNVSKNCMTSSMFSCFGRWFCCIEKKKPRNNSSKHLTIQTIVTQDSDDMVTETTLIDCINGTKRSEPKPNADSIVKLPQCKNQCTPDDQLNTVIKLLHRQAEEFQKYMTMSKKQRKSQNPEFLNEHQAFLNEVARKLCNLNVPSASTLTILPQSSTPYRSNTGRKPITFSATGSHIANSIYCVDSTVDKSDIDDNRSDWTLADISSLLQSKVRSLHNGDSHKNAELGDNLADVPLSNDVGFEAEMQNFKELLNKIRVIMDDTYSDNTELASATKRLEHVLDGIIRSEEEKRASI